MAQYFLNNNPYKKARAQQKGGKSSNMYIPLNLSKPEFGKKTNQLSGDVDKPSSQLVTVIQDEIARSPLLVEADQTIIEGSTNAVSGDAVYDGLTLKQDASTALALGTTSTTALAGDTVTITTAQSTAIGDNTNAIAQFESAKATVLADDTTVAPSTAGTPTLAEIQTFVTNDSITDTVVYYTGDDLTSSTPIYVYYADITGSTILIESPAVSEICVDETIALGWMGDALLGTDGVCSYSNVLINGIDASATTILTGGTTTGKTTTVDSSSFQVTSTVTSNVFQTLSFNLNLAIPTAGTTDLTVGIGDLTTFSGATQSQASYGWSFEAFSSGNQTRAYTTLKGSGQVTNYRPISTNPYNANGLYEIKREGTEVVWYAEGVEVDRHTSIETVVSSVCTSVETVISNNSDSIIDVITDTATNCLILEGKLSATLLDEDDMAANSTTAVATQQSIKTYTDSKQGLLGTEAPVNGTTVAYFTGQTFFDSTNGTLYIATTESTSPFVDGTGSVWETASSGSNPVVNCDRNLWTSTSGITVASDEITLVPSGAASWGVDGGFNSNYKLAAGADGYFEIELTKVPATDSDGRYMIGLSSSEEDFHFNTIDHAFYIHSIANSFRVYEQGVSLGDFFNMSSLVIGDLFRMQRTGTTLEFKRNGTTFHTSSVISNTDLFVDMASFGSGVNTIPLTYVGFECVGTTSREKIYIAGLGQSNMDGRDGLNGDTVCRDNVFGFEDITGISPGNLPLACLGLDANTPAWQLANKIAFHNPEKDVIVIESAAGATSISEWYTGNSLLVDFQTKLSFLGITSPDLIIWSQGERDRADSGINTGVTDMTEVNDNYYNAFQQVYSDFESAGIVNDRVPFILNTLAEGTYAGLLPNEAIRRTGRDAVFNTNYYESANLATIDGVHFSGDSLDTMGIRAYTTYLNTPYTLVDPNVDSSLTVTSGVTGITPYQSSVNIAMNAQFVWLSSTASGQTTTAFQETVIGGSNVAWSRIANVGGLPDSYTSGFGVSNGIVGADQIGFSNFGGGAYSTNTLVGDGSLTWEMGSIFTGGSYEQKTLIGLDLNDGGNVLDSTNYSMVFTLPIQESSRNVEIFENDQLVYTFTQGVWNQGDAYEIRVTGTEVSYYGKGVLVYTSTTPVPSTPAGDPTTFLEVAEAYANNTIGATPSTVVGVVADDQTGLVGTETTYARADHKHIAQSAANTPSTAVGTVTATDVDTAISQLEGTLAAVNVSEAASVPVTVLADNPVSSNSFPFVKNSTLNGVDATAAESISAGTINGTTITTALAFEYESALTTQVFESWSFNLQYDTPTSGSGRIYIGIGDPTGFSGDALAQTAFGWSIEYYQASGSRAYTTYNGVKRTNYRLLDFVPYVLDELYEIVKEGTDVVWYVAGVEVDRTTFNIPLDQVLVTPIKEVAAANSLSIAGLETRIPEAPSTDATYTLQAVVTGGTPVYSWV